MKFSEKKIFVTKTMSHRAWGLCQKSYKSKQVILIFFFFNFSVRRYKEPLNQYLYMTDLLDRNERLFYKLLSENVEELMPVVYTPTVGLACQKFGYTFTRPAVIWVFIISLFYSITFELHYLLRKVSLNS